MGKADDFCCDWNLPAHHEVNNLIVILLFRYISAHIREGLVENRQEHVDNDESYGHHKQEDKYLKQ